LAERNRKIQVYSLSQIKTIIEQSEGWLKVYFLLSFTTGMRVGEILGLKWVDFDLEEGLLNLERSRNKGKEVGSSKTKDHERTIALFPEVLEELRYFATNPLHEEYLFVNTRQQPWYDSKALRKNAIEPFFTKHKIPYLKLKATRASCITNLVKAGVPLPFVQSMVGHSKGSRVTIKHYFDSDETIEEKKENALNAAAKLNQRLLASA
jgi:integrase